MVKNDQKMSFCSYSLNCQFHHSSYQKKLPNFFKSPISREIREIDWLGRVFSLTAFLNLEHFGFSTGFFSRFRSVKDLKFGGVILLDILQVRCYFSSRYFMKKPIFLPFLLIFIFFLKKNCHLCVKIWTKYFFHDLILNGHLEIDAI